MVQAVAARPDVPSDEVWAAPEHHPPGRLRGRSREREQLGRLLTGIRSGRSGVLVVHGEAGIGKTALLEQLIERAMLGLLAEVGEQEPLLCIIDDAQWLDQASALTLAFVARRLMAESVALVFAVRDPADEQNFAGLPQLIVEGLNDEDARGVLGWAI